MSPTTIARGVKGARTPELFTSEQVTPACTETRIGSGYRRRDGAPPSSCACLPCRVANLYRVAEYELGIQVFASVFPCRCTTRSIFDIVLRPITGPRYDHVPPVQPGAPKGAEDDAASQAETAGKRSEDRGEMELSVGELAVQDSNAGPNSVGAVFQHGIACAVSEVRGSGF